MPSRYTGVSGLDASLDATVARQAGGSRDASELAAVTGVAGALREMSGEVRDARNQMGNGIRIIQVIGERVGTSAERLDAAVQAIVDAGSELPGACARAVRDEVRASLSRPSEAARAAWDRAERAERGALDMASAAASRLDGSAKEASRRVAEEVDRACRRIYVSSLAHYAVLVACALVAVVCAWTAWGVARPLETYRTATSLDEANLTIDLQNAELEAYRGAGAELDKEQRAALEEEFAEIRSDFEASHQ